MQTLSQREREQARAAEEFEQACKRNDELEAEISRLEGEITQAKQDKILGIIREPARETAIPQKDLTSDRAAQTEKASPSEATSAQEEGQVSAPKSKDSSSSEVDAVGATLGSVTAPNSDGEEPKEKSKEKADEKEKINSPVQEARDEARGESEIREEDAAEDFDPLADA